MTRVGLLHTVPALAPGFDERVRAAVPGSDVVHLVQAQLLSLAVAQSPDVPELTRAACRALVGLDCDAILVTCSSIGEVATTSIREGATSQDADLPVPVLRVDAPMAAEAARIAAAAGPGSRIVVLATQPSTLGPSGRLVTDAATRRPEDRLSVDTVLVEGAAAALARGERPEHDRLLLAAAAEAQERCAVIVLAQASMVAAFDGADVSVPVLSSPESGVAALAALLAEQGDGS
ncbi:arylsulfatase [Xylanimonas protaetiae]|uniref:Arylsulfatase n=1 Tax=Xylanimonas protaetiae TaxID=2509457 RepID=A0A4P6F799_9MICO|nr:arylsulfatase [Xylanimonas protaetiae]QAY71642.1 arylsulfatase [Xylanimonas protaetiae]